LGERTDRVEHCAENLVEPRPRVWEARIRRTRKSGYGDDEVVRVYGPDGQGDWYLCGVVSAKLLASLSMHDCPEEQGRYPGEKWLPWRRRLEGLPAEQR
jgi:hypothetical protein